MPRRAPLSDGPGAEPAYCAACDLHHARRPDWLCPKCGMPVEYDAALSSRRARAAAAEHRPPFPAGSLVAGAVMAVTSLALALGFARDPATDHPWPLVAAIVLLGVLGLELLIKVHPARWVVAAAVPISAVILSESLVRARAPGLMPDPLPPVVRAALRDAIRALSPTTLLLVAGLLVGSLVLVVGRPGRARIAAGALLAAPLAIAGIVRAFLPLGGQSP